VKSKGHLEKKAEWDGFLFGLGEDILDLVLLTLDEKKKV